VINLKKKTFYECSDLVHSAISF